MKTHLKKHYGIYLAGISLFFLFGFAPAKYSPDFKKAKKGIDTLTIFSPVDRIVANDNQTEHIDLLLTKENQALMNYLTAYQ